VVGAPTERSRAPGSVWQDARRRTRMNADRLKKLPLFGDLPHKQLERIAMWAD
jgi:hypothetical protein